jgi:hypothetical protein
VDRESQPAGLAGLDLDFLEWRVQERIYRRGRSYFRRGAVLSCRPMPEGIEGEVQGSGSQPYRVRISRASEGDFAPECDCAYDRDPWCKHAVALALRHLEEQHRESGGSLQADLNLSVLRRAPSFARALPAPPPNPPARPSPNGGRPLPRPPRMPGGPLPSAWSTCSRTPGPPRRMAGPTRPASGSAWSRTRADCSSTS